ncbi:MAG: hypothetical protein AAGD38_18420 [Acidobacteriota bacterium]
MSVDEPTPRATTDGLTRISFYSVLSGLPRLAPLPFVDDWARDFLRRRLLRELVATRPFELSEPAIRHLAGGSDAPTLQGCLTGCLSVAALKTALYIVKVVARSIFRKILFFLAVKDVVDTAAETWQIGFLLRLALDRGDLTRDEPVAVGRVRAAIEATCAEVDTRIIEGHLFRLLRRSPRQLLHAARRLGRTLTSLRRRSRETGGRADTESASLGLDNDPFLGHVADELGHDMATDTAYLRELETVYLRNLGIA